MRKFLIGICFANGEYRRELLDKLYGRSELHAFSVILPNSEILWSTQSETSIYKSAIICNNFSCSVNVSIIESLLTVRYVSKYLRGKAIVGKIRDFYF